MPDDDDKPLTPEQLAVEDRQLKATRLYLRGKVYREIAKELGVSHTQVKRDLDAVRAQWAAEAITNIDDAVKRQEARYEHLIAEAFEAWEASKGTHEKKTSETTSGEKGDTTKEGTVTEESAGDPRFLAEIRHCQEQIAKLKGWYAAIKIDNTHKGVLAIEKSLVEAV